ncbi:MAG TPA: PP2C family serine/threonine-protein phosphatase [Blastocatellia bacterium]|nr:PP2C family serine/threonine-protein phosphatase [Blastocatellia bacterium]
MAEEVGFKISVFAKSDLGMVRPGNEDNFLVLNLSTADTWKPGDNAKPPGTLGEFTQSHYGSLVAVTDGMGGALAGEVASRLAVECVRDRMLELQASPAYSKFPFHERLRLSIELANLYIYQMSLKRAEYSGMGATFTAVGLSGSCAYFGQVGDSRAYLIRGDNIEQITRDQSLVGQLVEAGHITAEEAERHSYKNVILQALGASPSINVVIDRLTLCDNDTLVLCSDGLSNKVRADEIKAAVDECSSFEEACGSLIRTANDRGGEDNITVMIARVSGGRLKSHQQPPDQRTTLPLADDSAQGRWGAETLERDPELPFYLDHGLVDDEETTIPPEDDTLPPRDASS